MFDVGCCARSRRNMCIRMHENVICYHDKYRWRLHGAPPYIPARVASARAGPAGSAEALGRPTRISLHHTRHGYEFTYAWAVHAAARLTGSHEAHTAGIHIPLWRTWSRHIVIDTSDRIGMSSGSHTWLKQPTAADSLFSQPLQRLGPPCPPCLAVPPLKPAESSSFRWARRSRARSFAAASASCQRW